ncbi:hypothetical protein Tco_1305813 [Tanacetum coccineum]
MEKASDQVPLLEATRRCVVPLAPPVLVTTASSEGNMTESIDRLFDEGNGAEKEHSTGGGEYVALTEAIVEPVNEDVVEKPKRLRKKRKATEDASSSTLPPKKLRDDYGTSGASASTGGKSHAVMQGLLDNSKLAAEIRVIATANAPMITSSVTPMLESEVGDHTDSVSGTNLRTKPAAVRFVISSDSSHHSGTHVVDVEVSSLVRSTVLDPTMMTATVTTTAAVGTSLVLVSKVTVKLVNPTLFGDSMSTSGHDIAGPSSLVYPELSADSFYVIQDLNPETLQWVYVPKWTVANESYDQLYTEFNVGAARQTCLDFEVRMRAEHTLRKKEILEEECAQQTNLLKEKDAKITTCAKLRNQVAGYELFKEQIEAVQDDQVRVLTEKIAEVDASLMGMALQLDDEYYPSYLTMIVG